jgi:hypothetical protein
VATFCSAVDERSREPATLSRFGLSDEVLEVDREGERSPPGLKPAASLIA